MLEIPLGDGCGCPDGAASPVLSRRAVLGGVLGAALLTAAPPLTGRAGAAVAPPRVADVDRVDPDAVVRRWTGVRPSGFGTALPGILGRVPVRSVVVRGRRRPVACLTFDACGNPAGGAASIGFDDDLVDFLVAHRVPATLFVSWRWATARPRMLERLAREPLFEIASHGTLHRPLTVDGRVVYGIAGTASAEQAVREVWRNTRHLASVTGLRPRLFRSGTAHYDDVGVAIVRSLGQLPVGFSTNADSGATAPATVVRDRLLAMVPGGVALGHVNRPGGATAEGVMAAVPRMRRAGWVFCRVSDALP